MLVQFSVRNYKVFKEEARLTLFASNYDKTTLEADNVVDASKFGLRLLKSAVVYGANASGKTKLIDAAYFMRTLVESSSKESQRGEPIRTEPFRLSTATEGEPSLFEIIFLHKNELFRYGFEVTRQKVESEWLYHRPNTKEVEIFYREGQVFVTHPRLFRKGSLLVKEGMVRPNALMLSVAAQFNDELAERVLDWFQRFRQLSGLSEEAYLGYSMSRIEDERAKTLMLHLMREADIGMEDMEVSKLDAESLPDEFPDELRDLVRKKMKEEGAVFFGDMKTLHAKYDAAGNRVAMEAFTMNDQESSGTRKFFALMGPLLKALEHGEVLMVDELDSKIHPKLVRELAQLFNSAATNPKNAQLIFNTHDTNLLSAGLFRRDQIWFVEKDRYGAATLYSLASFKTSEVRKHDNFEDNYLIGRYGGLPAIGNFEYLPEVEIAGRP